MDVVVIGAGAAGLAAARVLAARGLSYTIVEASSRIGGRAWTDRRSLPFAWDRGAAWIHHGDENPFADFASDLGIELINHDELGETVVLDGGRVLGPGATAAMVAEYDALSATIADAAESGRDLSAAEAASRGARTNPGEWRATAETLLGPCNAGADLADFSALDWSGLAGIEPNLLPRGGYGALVERFGAGLNIMLSCNVNSIDWSDGGMTLETTRGSMRARAAILTVPIGVLKSGAIRFTPNLPATTEAALDGLEMGLLSKIALLLDPEKVERFGWSGFGDWTDAVPRLKQPEGGYALLKPWGQPCAIYHYGGSFAASMSGASESDLVAFGRERLGAMFGSSAAAAVIGGAATDWLADPLARGGYAYARPGHAGARAMLSEPVGDRIWFAGEATAGRLSQTVDGARAAGEAAAADVANHLAG